jgi:ATP-dependent Clp protease, protease subunit
MKNWFKITAKAEMPEAEISIYDEIGAWGVTAKDFIGELRNVKAQSITLSINSPGGSVFDALAIYNALRQHEASVTVKVMGVAASAASLIAMAGDKIVMPENAFMMIHNPINFAYGNADEMREMADILDKIGASLVGTYVARTGLPEDEVKALLDAETWLNAEEAVAKGFADEIEVAFKAVASFDMDRLPENVKAVFAVEPDDETSEDESDDIEGAPVVDFQDTLATQVSAVAVSAGLGDFAATWLLDESIENIDQATAAINTAREIRDICNLAGHSDKAPQFIRNRASLQEVRSALFAAMAKQDEATNVSNVVPNKTSKPLTSSPVASVKTAAIWDARRKSV